MGKFVEMYCDKCGKTWEEYMKNDETKVCSICGNSLKVVPEEYFEDYEGMPYLSREMKQKLVNERVLTSPNFDQYFFEHKAEIKAQLDRKFSADWERIKAFQEEKSRAPKCPICQSTNLSKLSSLGKATKIGLFGIFGADDLGKTYKCNHCGSKF